jgi:hypothetical protein
MFSMDLFPPVGLRACDTIDLYSIRLLEGGDEKHAGKASLSIETVVEHESPSATPWTTPYKATLDMK